MLALAALLSFGPGVLHAAQDDLAVQNPPDSVRTQDATAGLIRTAPFAGEDVYIPEPELSPSTDSLFFNDMLPGESRTLFMDLANLGDGEILLDSLAYPAGMMTISLPENALRPGQFVRFPVTYRQADLKVHDIEIEVHWSSPQYERVEILFLKLLATAAYPLRAYPERAIWSEAYVGVVNNTRIQLRNLGVLPIFFQTPVTSNPDVQISTLPPLLATESSISTLLSWSPETTDIMDGLLQIPYKIGDADGILDIPIAGTPSQLAYLSEDTVRWGTIYAGSSYRSHISVRNGSGYHIILKGPESGAIQVHSVPGTESNQSAGQWFDIPARLEIPPRSIEYLEVVLAPRRAGLYHFEIPFRQLILSTSQKRSLPAPDVVLPIQAEVKLPITAAPETLEFGGQPVLRTASNQCVLQNQGATSVDISLALATGLDAYSFPPMMFTIEPNERIQIPVYFHPSEMINHVDELILGYRTFGERQELHLKLTGQGLDRPLLRLNTLADVTIGEDFGGPLQLADLNRYFQDANHLISYQVIHPFEGLLSLVIDENNQLQLSSTPNYHGQGDVIVQAMNEMGIVQADTFRLTVTAVNDLPRLMASIDDLVLEEDTAPMIVGKLSEMFYDPDRDTDTVVTHFSIYSSYDDEAVRLSKEGDKLLLTIAPDWNGSRTLIVSASDGADPDATVFDSFKVTVLPANDPPRIRSIPAIEMIEDDTVHLNWYHLVKDIDNTYDELTLTFTAPSGGAVPFMFERTDGILIVRPRANWFGDSNLRITVTDAEGAADSHDWAVRVTPANDPPGRFRLQEPMIQTWEQRLSYSGRDTLIEFKWQSSLDADPGESPIYSWQLMDTTGRVLREMPAGESTSVAAYFDTAGIFLWSVLARDEEGSITASDTIIFILDSSRRRWYGGEGDLIFSFGPNYPNPFSGATRIEYAIPRYSYVVISVFDAMGKKVRVLRSEPHYRGHYEVMWDGRDNNGQRVASGSYVAEIRSGNNSAYLKLVVVH
ncbi:Ig-like domain-containing protein [Candidatus Neomarinimicrobiota bacterium]